MSAKLTLFLFAALAAGSPSQTLDDVLNRVDKAGAQFKGMTANFQHLKHTAIINEDAIATGIIRIRRPQPHDMQMLLDYAAPDRKTVQFSGQTLNIYLPNIKTVQEYDLGKHKDMLEQLFLLGFGTSRRDLEATYSVSLGGPDPVRGEAATRIILIPKSSEMQKHLSKFELWVSNKTGQPLQQKVFEPKGDDYNVFTYWDMKVNPMLGESSMKLQLPKGTKKEIVNR